MANNNKNLQKLNPADIVIVDTTDVKQIETLDDLSPTADRARVLRIFKERATRLGREATK